LVAISVGLKRLRRMLHRAALLLFATSLFAADFQNGQAARGVLGQPSFTSREPGINITSMVAEHGRLYAADAAHRVLTFNLAKFPDPHEDFSSLRASACGVCGAVPASVSNQSVLPGMAAYSTWGRSVAVIDRARHRVLLWRDSRALNPDIILGQSSQTIVTGPAALVDPVSVALDGKRLFIGDAALHRVLVWNALPSANDQPADAVLGQPNFFTTAAVDSPTPASIGVPSAMVSDGTTLFVADTGGHRILLFSCGDGRLAVDDVVNAASLLPGPLAPGTLVSITGSGLSDVSDTADADQSRSLPTRLAGVEMIFDGQALPLLSVAPGAVEAQLPYDFGGRTGASLWVRTEHTGGVVSVTAPRALQLAPANPGLFALGGKEPREAILLHAGLGAGFPVTRQDPVKPGELVSIWATGLGSILETDGGSSAALHAGVPHQGTAALVSTPLTARINGQDANVVSASLPEGAIGVYEIKIAVPLELAVGGEAQLTVAQNGRRSNTVTFPVE
jgi:uncharacterized protein (TIGR03437 family)